MNMQTLSVLVNYVIDQYIHILLAKTRKICEILSKKTVIGEREKYTKRHRDGKRERERQRGKERKGWKRHRKIERETGM